MTYESSYETGCTQFQPDSKRGGTWVKNHDFFWAALILAFRLDIFLSPYLFTSNLNIISLVLHFIFMASCVVPVYILQIFIGQFSSSGFVTAFRLAPIFKGIGYISLFANSISLCVYSIFAAIPLFYFINSLRPALPWSCEHFDDWWKNRTYESHICRTSENNLAYLQNSEKDNSSGLFSVTVLSVPSVLYFRSHFSEDNEEYGTDETLKLSIEMMICSLLIWLIISWILYKSFDVQKFGCFLRYACWTTISLLIICMIRLTFLPTAREALLDYISPSNMLTYIPHICGNVPLQALSAFGSAWGSLICLASFNQFRTNVERSSWLISFGQLIIYSLFSLISTMLEVHLNDYAAKYDDNSSHYEYVDNHANIYLSAASVFSSLHWPNFWSLVYYGMLVLCNVTFMALQVYTILVSAFDAFVSMRPHKMRITFSFIAIMALLSVYFCSSHGVLHNVSFSLDILFSQIVLYLLLLLVVLWIYGRERFQRDFEFMCNRPYATWKLFVLRFLTPICLLFLLLLIAVAATYEHLFTSSIFFIVALVLTLSIWIFIPAYCVLIMFQTTGSVWMRFKRCCRPLDWYPAGATERQLYEEALGNADITHQLHEITETDAEN